MLMQMIEHSALAVSDVLMIISHIFKGTYQIWDFYAID